MSALVRTLAALTLAASLVLTGNGVAQAGPVIRGAEKHWSPPSVQVSTGTVVRWRGVSQLHNVTAYGGNWSFSRPLPAGASVRLRFRVAGTFLFRCTLHSTIANGVCSGMCGRVVVRR